MSRIAQAKMSFSLSICIDSGRLSVLSPLSSFFASPTSPICKLNPECRWRQGQQTSLKAVEKTKEQMEEHLSAAGVWKVYIYERR